MMRIFPKPVSDEEHIARIRSALKSEPWFRGFNLVLGIAWVVMAIWLLVQFVQMLPNFAGAGQQKPAFGLFLLGIVMGFISGQVLWQAFHQLVRRHVVSRSDRLAVVLWDQLHATDLGSRSNSAETSSITLENAR